MRRLTHYDGPDFAPDLSADGARIAFVSDRDEPGNLDIYVMDADGGNIRRITSEPAIETRPSWAPDGRALAFTRAHGDTFELWTVDLDRGDERRLTWNDAQDLHPTWSPDGSWIVVARYLETDLELFAVAPDGTGEERLTHLPGEDRDPEWSPDGNMIVFVHSTQERGAAALYVLSMDPAGGIGDVRPLTEERPGLADPVWSADGSWIVFSAPTPDGYAFDARPVQPSAANAPDASTLEVLSQGIGNGYRLLGIDGTL